MAQPRGRGRPNNRRGGGYSSQRGTSRGSSRGGQRGAGAGGAYRNGGSRGGPPRGGGIGTGPLLAVIGGGVVLIVVLVLLIMSAGKTELEPLTVANQPDPAPSSGGGRINPASKVLPPLSPTEREHVNKVIDRLAERAAEAKRLIDEGYRAQDVKDYETAQDKWHRAYDMLFDMNRQASALFESFGEDMDGYDRVERDCPRAFRKAGSWDEEAARVFKNLKSK